jgi:hypothetical protein
MPTKRQLVRVIFGVVLFVALVLVLSFTPFVPYPYGILTSGGLGLLSYRLSERLFDFALGRESKLRLSFSPLSFSPKTRFNPLQCMSGVSAFAEGITVVDGKQVAGTVQQNTIEIRFGMIQGTSLSGDAVGCKASVKMETKIAASDKTIWVEKGFLNWYSFNGRRQVFTIKRLNGAGIDESSSTINRQIGINHYLNNIEETVHEDDPKNLQLFYVLKNGNVFLCTELDNQMDSHAGTVAQGPLTIRLEITFTAQGIPKTVRRYDVKVLAWDDFIIKEAQLS